MRQRRAWLVTTGVAYLALVASLFTDVYHPFGVGDDRSGWVLLVFAAAQLALGAAWPTAWSFALPLPIGIAGVIVASHVDEPIGVAFAVIAIPVAYVLVAIGRLLAWANRRRDAPERVAISVPVVLFLTAAAPLAEAARESWHVATAPRVPAALARQLPLDEYTLNSLCSNELPANLRDEFKAQANALIATTRRHPGWILTATYTPADEPGEGHEDMTVRQLAQNQLGVLRDFPACEPDLQRALADAIK